MLAKPMVFKTLFPLIALAMWAAYAPMTLLHWAAPRWARLANARRVVGILARGALKEPGPKQANPYFQPGDTRFSWEPGPCWSLGFAAENLTSGPAVRENIRGGRYQVAGYQNNVASSDIRDDLLARAVYLDDNTGRGGILYAVADCVGLSNTDVRGIRALAWDWARAAGIRSIQVAASHTHAGIDTVGIWQVPPFDGKDADFQRLLVEQTAKALRAAYDNRRDGRLYHAAADAGDMFKDTRPPEVIDKTITRLRFAPQDPAAPGVYLVCAGCHPEIAGKRNSVISADFPAYAAEAIKEKTGAETMFIQGMEGGLITVRDLSTVSREHGKGNVGYGLSIVKDYGAEFAGHVLGEGGLPSPETELPPLLNFAGMEFELPLENLVLLLGMKVGMLNHTVYRTRRRPYAYALTDEVGYLRLGGREQSLDILITSGELAPELALGGFFGKEEAALGEEYPRKPLYETLRGYPFASAQRAVFGLANNFIGYVLPENDFLLNKKRPYIEKAVDRFGRSHYEETNSAGPRAAGAIMEAFARLFGEVQV